MKRIAVVEDNEDNRILVHAMLSDEYRITEYTCGRSAIEGIRADPPDLVLLDISIPGLDGTQVLEHLKGDPRTAALPVVALTAHAMNGDRDRFLETGFDGYVSKPITDELDLLDAVAAAIGRGEH